VESTLQPIGTQETHTLPPPTPAETNVFIILAISRVSWFFHWDFFSPLFCLFVHLFLACASLLSGSLRFSGFLHSQNLLEEEEGVVCGLDLSCDFDCKRRKTKKKKKKKKKSCLFFFFFFFSFSFSFFFVFFCFCFFFLLFFFCGVVGGGVVVVGVGGGRGGGGGGGELLINQNLEAFLCCLISTRCGVLNMSCF